MKSIVCFCVILIFLLPSVSFSGKKTKKVKGEASVSMDNISRNAARNRAFREAESSALESVVKELSSIKVQSINEKGEEYSDLYQQNISSRTTGWIIDSDTLVDTVLIMDVPGNAPGLFYHVEIEATILVEEIDHASPYNPKLEMKPSLRFNTGDEAKLFIDLKKESYLHIFNITAENKVLILYPLSQADVKPIKPGGTFVFPSGGSKMSLYPLPDHDVDIEEIRVLATKEPFQFFASDLVTFSSSGNYIDLQATDLITLEMEILRIPYDERGQAKVVYKIYSK